MIRNTQIIRETGAVLAIAIALLAATAHWVLSPRAGEARRIDAERYILSASMNQPTATAAINARLDQIAQRINEIDRRNSATTDSVGLYDDILRRGLDAGLIVGRINPGLRQTLRGNVNLLSIRVSAKGGYDQIARFFRSLETMKPFHQIGDFRLFPRDTTDGRKVVALDVEIQFSQVEMSKDLAALRRKVVTP